jgi:hypothetical protein
VVITFRVYNSTERTVTGLNMLVPKQWLLNLEEDL